MTPLLRYRSAIIDATQQYELTQKQKLFLWYSGMDGNIATWFEDCFHALQDLILDYTFDQVCSLIIACFNREFGLREATPKCLQIFDAFNTTGEFSKDGFKTLQDIPHLSKIFPLIVSSTTGNTLSLNKQSKDLTEYNDAVETITENFKTRRI